MRLHQRHKRLTLLLLLLIGVVLPLAAQAETKVIVSEATYLMGDGETPFFAEAQVLQRAKQIALEQAGTYVESYTKVQNLNLTTEEIQTIAGGVMTIEVLDKSRTLVGDGLKLSIKIKATVTTDKMEELARRIKGKNVAEEYKKLQEEYARLSQEVESWKKLAAKTPQGAEREAALDQIREREQAFALVQKSEAALFQRLVSGQALVTEADDHKALIGRLIESIKKDGHVIEIGKVSSFPVEGKKDRLTLTVPITLTPSPLLPTLLSDAARLLGGDEVRPAPFKSPIFYGLINGSIEEEGVTVVTTPSEGQGYSGWYSEPPHPDPGRRQGYESRTRATSVRLSNSRPVSEYFLSRVPQLVLVVELVWKDIGTIADCRVPFIVNRLVSGLKAGPAFYIDQRHYRPYAKQESGENDSILLLTQAVRFNVEFNLESGQAMRVDQVIAWWLDWQVDKPLTKQEILDRMELLRKTPEAWLRIPPSIPITVCRTIFE